MIHSSAARAAAMAANPKSSIRVLLIEDNQSDVLLVSRMLSEAWQRNTFDICNVPRLSDALDQLHAQHFDIVLLDLNLLDISGVAAVAALRMEVGGTPIIVYSGVFDPQLRQDALLCGARHYLVKGRESAFSLRFMIQQVLDQQ